MGLSRGNGDRFSSNVWPGFVDALSALLMVLIFALTIFMVLQSVMRDTITTQDSELDRLSGQVSQLSDALSLSDERAATLDRDLLAERDRLRASEQEVAGARQEIDAQTEAARLAAARREALEALIADLRRRNAETGEALRATEGKLQDSTAQLTVTEGKLQESTAQLTEAEALRLADAAAAEALRARLNSADAELTAMTLRLEDARKKAEDTLTLLAAADAAKKDLSAQVDAQMTEAQRQAGLLALAQGKLKEQEALSTEEQRRVALLNQQVAQLNTQLGSLQAVLNAAGAQQQEADLKVEDLGRQLNIALLRAADEERKRLALETEARAKAEAEAKDLARYRSEFFGRLSQILEGREGVKVVGDRFVFSSEVLFPTGEATLSPEGQAQIARVADMLREVATQIPPEIDWIIRVDGHTDSQPLSGQGRYRDNWELSQARALAVVRYMVDDLGFPANRLAATGFADTRPVAQGDTPEARAQNRRIELKLTER